MKYIIQKAIKFIEGILHILLLVVVTIIVVAGFVVGTIRFCHNREALLHKPLTKDGSPSGLVYHPVTQPGDSIVIMNGVLPGIADANVAVENKRVMEGDNVILNKIIDTTSNTITYFSAIIAALALFAGFAMWKYYQKIIAAQQRIQELGNSVLQNALITLHAVPFVKATQITSSEHLLAIEHIAKLAKKEREAIQTDAQYAPLLLCLGLAEYFAGRYKDAIEAMKDADRLCRIDDPPFRKVVAFHLARTYKQAAYSELENKSIPNTGMIIEYLAEAEGYTNHAPTWLQNSLRMSIAAIKRLSDSRHSNKEVDGQDAKKKKHCLRSFILRVLKKGTEAEGETEEETKEGDGVNRFQTIIDNCVKIDKESKTYSFDRMTAIPIWLNLHSSDEDDYKKNAEDFIKYMESRLQGQSGDNIFASWYFSLARVQAKIGNKQEALRNLSLAFSYFDAIRYQKGVKTMFTYDCLTEISKEKFIERMNKLMNQLTME